MSLEDDWDWTRTIHADDGVAAGLFLGSDENSKASKSPFETPQILSCIFIFSGFDDVLLSGFRALSEQQPFAEDYSSFK